MVGSKEVVRERFKTFLCRNGDTVGMKYEVDPLSKSDIFPWNDRDGVVKGKRSPEKTSSHAELEFYLIATQLSVILELKSEP